MSFEQNVVTSTYHVEMYHLPESSHFPGTYELRWSSCTHSWAPQMCCLHIYSVWKVHVKWKCGQMLNCMVSLNFCVWSMSHAKYVDVVNFMGTATVHAFHNEKTINTVEDRQPICMPRHVHNGWLAHADVVIRGERSIKVTNCLRGKLFTL